MPTPFNTVFTSLIVLHVLLAFTGQGQAEANVLRRQRRATTAGHSSRQSHVIRGLLNIPGHDESFQRRQSGCDIGFYPCSDGTGCCPYGMTCDHLKDGKPTCCCSIGNNCQTGELVCSANTTACCAEGDLCSSDGTCWPAGSGGGGGSGGGNSGGGNGGGSGGGNSGGGSGGGNGGGGNGGGSGGGNSGGGSGGGNGGGGSGGGNGGGGNGGGGSGGSGTSTTFITLPFSSPTFGGDLTTSPALVVSTPVVTVPGSTGSFGTGQNGALDLRAGTAMVMMGSVIVASGLALLIL